MERSSRSSSGDVLSLELVAMVPWSPGGLPSEFEEVTSGGWMSAEHRRRVRSPVRLRLDGGGGLHLLGRSGGLVHLTPTGDTAGSTPLTDREGRVVDYACEANGSCVLLELLRDLEGGRLNRLRRLDAAGNELWSRSGPARSSDLDFDQLAGSFSSVLLDDGGRIFLPAARDGGRVAVLDAATGDLHGVLRLREQSGAPYLSGDRLHTVFFDEGLDLRRAATAAIDGGDERLLHGGAEHHAWLVHPLGADAASRFYVWRQGEVARLALSGEIEMLGALTGVAVRTEDGAVFSSGPAAGRLGIIGPGVRVELAGAEGFRLVQVDAEGRYHLFGGEEPGAAGEVRVYSPDGELESRAEPADLESIESVLPLPDAWRIGADGAVVIPVPTPNGLAVVRARSGS